MKKGAPRQLTWLPRRAIREHCLWCCEDREQEIEACASERCPLHRFRFGEAVPGEEDLHAVIRRKCLDCVMGLRSEVESCTSVDCSLWVFRLAKNLRLKPPSP
ncbi:MAG: hypothetical protein LLF99_06090 [Desulfobacteraceae bacterium]|nr:hypothetical protein [Desulfobacteraceae bacterium]